MPLLDALAMQKREASIVLEEKHGEVEIYSLCNTTGMRARITNYGGIVMSLHVPDRQGTLADVVLGYDTVDEYLARNPYFGCLVGRYGNRIAKAQFVLEGASYTLAANDGPNSLHGGIQGFDKVFWAARPVASPLGPALELHYLSPHLDEGFPGNLDVLARYTLTNENGLRVEFTAISDRTTIVNLTHHSYFNLAGGGDILGHQALIHADYFTPVDPTMIPTGEWRRVDGTPFDFRTLTTIGSRIDDHDEQLRLGSGYDHNWVMTKSKDELGLVARIIEPTSGRAMEVLSTEPGAQFYTGNFLDGSKVGKGGWRYHKRSGLCIEPQHFPDSPNQPGFPSVTLASRETYTNTIVYRFFTV